MSIFTRIKQKSTQYRLALGLTSITVTLMLIGGFIGLLPDHGQQKLQARAQLAEVVAVNGTLLLTHADVARMEAVLHHVVQRNPDILFALITRESGEEVARIEKTERAPHTATERVAVPIWSAEERWGSVELYFKPAFAPGIGGFLQQPLVRYILFVSLISFWFFFIYLGRMLKLLDPSQAIPDRVRSALDTMAEGLLVLDARQNIVLANQAFARILDSDAGDLVGLNCRRFHWSNVDDTPFIAKASPWGRAIETGEAITSQRIRLQLESGQCHTFMVNCSPVLANNGRAGGVLVSFDDVTVLEQQEIELLKSKEEAEIANRSKSVFLANMSHEIRTPMNAIMGFTEVLQRGYGEGDHYRRYLDTIAKNSRHLLELINDILDLSKVESGQIEVEKAPCAVHEIILDVVEVLGISAQNKGIALTYKPLTELPAQVHTDAGRVRQILTNLVGNAIKFTASGSVTVTSRYDLNAQGYDQNAQGNGQSAQGNGQLFIEVIDTGIGMNNTQREKIFDPFVQADSSITRRFGGTGLGLTISKKFAKALGGDIAVDSEVGRGSRFTLALDPGDCRKVPLLRPQQLLAARSEPHDQEADWQMPRAHVLVVDDSEENRDLIRLVLNHQGIMVTVAGNGVEALQIVGKNSFQLILMDVQMPEMDGYTAVGKMRELGVKTAIVALTAHAMKGIEQRCLQAGFDGYLGKPIKIDFLLEKVADYIGGKRVERPTSAIPVLQDRLVKTKGTERAVKYSDDKAPVISILQNNEKYRPIVSRFVIKLEQQLKEIGELHRARNYRELAVLAHKIKGSAGTVGFYTLTEPFYQLETAAQQQDDQQVLQMVADIGQLFQRIDRSLLQQDDTPAAEHRTG